MSIVSYPGNKPNKHELYCIKSIIGYSCSTENRTRHRVSANRAHLLSVPTNKYVIWDVKPRIVRKNMWMMP